MTDDFAHHEDDENLERRILTMVETLAPPIDTDEVIAHVPARTARSRGRWTDQSHSRRPVIAVSTLALVVLVPLAFILFAAQPTFIGDKGGAQNRAAQSDLTNAITSGTTSYTSNSTYGSTKSAVKELGQAEPELRFSAQPVTYDDNAHEISVRVSRDGHVLVLAAQNYQGTCWYAEDNEESHETRDGLTNATRTQGISYGSSNGAKESHCSAGGRPAQWGATYPAS